MRFSSVAERLAAPDVAMPFLTHIASIISQNCRGRRPRRPNVATPFSPHNAAVAEPSSERKVAFAACSATQMTEGACVHSEILCSLVEQTNTLKARFLSSRTLPHPLTRELPPQGAFRKMRIFLSFHLWGLLLPMSQRRFRRTMRLLSLKIVGVDVLDDPR